MTLSELITTHEHDYSMILQQYYSSNTTATEWRPKTRQSRRYPPFPSVRSSRNGIKSGVMLCCCTSDRKCTTNIRAAHVSSNGRCCINITFDSSTIPSEVPKGFTHYRHQAWHDTSSIFRQKKNAFRDTSLAQYRCNHLIIAMPLPCHCHVIVIYFFIFWFGSYLEQAMAWLECVLHGVALSVVSKSVLGWDIEE